MHADLVGADPEDADNSLLARVRSRGLRITAQRRAVAEALDGAQAHRSADEVLSRAKELLPEISRATVYSALSEFVELGVVNEVQFSRAKLYDPNAHLEHHHLLCEQCGEVWDVHVEGPMPRLVSSGSNLPAMSVRRVEVNFVGLCGACQPCAAAL